MDNSLKIKRSAFRGKQASLRNGKNFICIGKAFKMLNVGRIHHHTCGMPAFLREMWLNNTRSFCFLSVSHLEQGAKLFFCLGISLLKIEIEKFNSYLA